MSKDARRKAKAAEKKAAGVEAVKSEEVNVGEVKVEAAESKKVEVKKEATPVTEAKKEQKPERMTVAKLTDICHTLAEAAKECKEDLRDHEDRIVKLEEAVFGPNAAPVNEDINVNVEVEGSEQKTEKESEQKPEPQPEPTPEPQPEPQPEPAPDPIQTNVSKPDVKPSGFNGVGYAYKFRRSNGRIGITPSKTAADQASGGIFKKIFVEYIDGQINHVLTEEELANAGLF
ncbi:hypothetical protein IJG12_00230 [Candidatus Saccharibacteria bacterium]|nr:hypothetical protein [Candidatus Saccharibacteria bacterium]